MGEFFDTKCPVYSQNVDTSINYPVAPNMRVDVFFPKDSVS